MDNYESTAHMKRTKGGGGAGGHKNNKYCMHIMHTVTIGMTNRTRTSPTYIDIYGGSERTG